MSLQVQTPELISYLNNQSSILNYRQNELVKTEHVTFLPTGEVLIGSSNNPQKQLTLRSSPIFGKLGIASIHDDLRLQNELLKHQQEVIHICEDSKLLGSGFYVKGHTNGRIFNQLNIQSLAINERRLIFKEIVSFLCRVHNLSQNQSVFNYQAIIESSRIQYKTHETRIQTNIEDLLYWLPMNVPELTIQESLCLGNVELNNFIFDQQEIKLINVQQWNSVTIGNPFLELARFLSNYDIPYEKNVTNYGLQKIDHLLGLPSKQELINQYCIDRKLDTIKYLNYNTIIVLLQKAIFKQQCIKTKVDPERSNVFQQELEIISRSAWNIVLELTNDDPFQIKLRAETDQLLWAKYPVSQRCKSYYYRVRDFLRDEVFPMEQSQFDIVYSFNKDNHWKGLPGIEHLQRRAKSMGLWNLFIGDPVYGKGLNNLEYTFLSELMGTSFFGHEIFNCYAPETGNIKLLIMAATDYQKEKYLKPLLEGECKTFFAMSERNVASSDPTNFETIITKQGDGYVIKGSKWMVSGIQDERCKFGIVMGKTTVNPKSPFTEQTMFLVDTPHPNIKLKHPLAVFGYDEAPHGLIEVEFDNVYVPKENMLGKEGTAFAMSQGRLLGGRLHHSVRLLGLVRRAMDVLLERGQRRVHRGKKQKEDSAFQEKIGRMECDYQICKTMILNAAMVLDSLGGRHMQSLKTVSETKAFVPYKCQCIADECIQLFGAQAITTDYILQIAFQACRGLRLMDGPCELHKKQVARFTQGSHMFNELLNADGYIGNI
ncbi:unnamed protein product (macronuclear) [Paramecium tetraurelia]|uniref:Acyl-CoA dehydrogenase n=1 Tax=Paramecium tetraurelia TaxID=5888 RepID=A0E1R8_PARTE|nr:uncharacterized protein GSPATT00022406001 [Paramecium tetraurelia]CAK89235.1 unnamed protein product [Paramecium tetraurelia]|eukprot:XP_001456632.1 hypothetical protein (macronuclear) [Paramecium tetraurelia strain d4-2]